MADVESSAVVQQPPTNANSMNLNSIPLLASAELLGESNSAQVSLQQQQQSQPIAGAIGGGNGGSAGTSSNSVSNASSIALDVASSENSSLVNSGVIGSGVGGGNPSSVGGGKIDSGEPPSKKQMLDHPSTSAGSGNSASQHEKLEYRLGGILCCAVCLDLPKTAMYQCQMGHLMCAACFTHLLADGRLRDQIATCPNCRVEISKSTASRNLAVEKAASELPSECQFCNKEFPYKSLDRHEQYECQERPTNCKYSRIGCQWRGPNHETNEHERNCLHPTKSGYEVMAALEAHDARIKEEKKMFNTLIDLLSYEKIIFNDLQMKPYRTDEYVHKLFYETARFTAFNQQWVVKARINNSQRDPHQSNERTITYQLILKTKTTTPMSIHFFALKGPFSDMKVSTQIYKHEFTDQSSESDYYILPLPDSSECNRLLSNKGINFRLLMFLLNK
ncbi:cysteine and histidine-rich protein 1 homolog [Bactrocera neohumeralis]|uniref:cysteine and histidine-rich protein 1 homolog n=1 Tax=Bactrocera tryoni TaxID=59916 RepID=UPI001A97F001|nr:cysteine and histidine-rich protein 1 homolog [Bactrocera tryoni]XP_050333257.1 cysteine and histidine-rich protein 1 homolog [Bactrocera neohumeralis]